MAKTLADDRPDVVHVHNLYPLISPSVLVACRRAGVPVVMTNHNYMLTCPVVNHLHKGQVCEKCLGGPQVLVRAAELPREPAESLAYADAARHRRKMRFFRNDVAIQIVFSDFAKRRLLERGVCRGANGRLAEHGRTGPREVRREGANMRPFPADEAGKGVDVLLEAAARLPQIPFRLAGDGPALETLRAAARQCDIHQSRLAPLKWRPFIRLARFLVVPSKWFEGCPLVVSEAMSHGLPVIASRIGGLPEFVEDGVTGLLFEPGNAVELADKIRTLWEDPGFVRAMGRAGRQKAEREYNEEAYYPKSDCDLRKSDRAEHPAQDAHSNECARRAIRNRGESQFTLKIQPCPQAHRAAVLPNRAKPMNEVATQSRAASRLSYATARNRGPRPTYRGKTPIAG